MNEKDITNKKLEILKQQKGFDDVVAQILSTRVKQKTDIDMKKLVQGIKKTVNPKMIERSEEWNENKDDKE